MSSIQDKEHWFWGAVRSNKKIYIQILIASFVINIFALFGAFYVMTVYDRVIPNNAFDSLYALTIGIVVIVVFDFITKLIRSYFADVGSSLLDDNIADKLFKKFVSHEAGELSQNANNITSTVREFDGVRDFFGSQTMVLLVDVPFMFLFLAVLWSIGGNIVIVPLLIIPLVLIVSATVIPFLKVYSEKHIKTSSTKMHTLIELLNNLEAVKTSSGGSFLSKRWKKAVIEQNSVSIINKTVSNIAVIFSQTSQQLSQNGMVFYGVFLIASADLSMGALIACIILSGRCMAPLAQLGQVFSRLNNTLAAYKRLDHLMKEESIDEKFDAESHTIAIANGSFNLEKLNFINDGRSILENINLKINAGEKVSILGPIGGGKSTLLKCLVGFNKVENGQIFIDGFDINNISGEELRRAIAYVPQKTQLFSGTIFENITAGIDNPTMEKVEIAAKISGCHEFIGRLPNGYDFVLGEHGRNLSEGQRQTIAIARAIIREPKILIMDEPTSSMDGETEKNFIMNIKEFSKDLTLILTTHKNSLLGLTDRTIVIGNGNIMVDGPIDQVVQRANKGQKD